MVLPAVTLLDPRRTNYYFADFYCNKITHYVTVVVCERKSLSDKYANFVNNIMEVDLGFLVREPSWKSALALRPSLMNALEIIPLSWISMQVVLIALVPK